MKSNNTLSIHSIEKIIEDTVLLLEQMETIPQMEGISFENYKTICKGIPEKIQTGYLKIAVVGVIKSGKSTFVNSLVGKELVKRGAGVITSITTRIRKGRKNQARIFFKSWDQINSQLQNALLSFPDGGTGKSDSEPFDIRRKNDRAYLETVYQTLINSTPVAEDKISPETLLIRYALHGYDDCRSLVQADETTVCFGSKEFDKYKPYTSDPNKAFYVKDVCLDLFGRTIDSNIEFADCQGADSTDPSQLGHIIHYLESSNLIIYCISSRTGLRQSDMTFLKRIQNLGLLENIIFINNCDLTEHENLDDLKKIEAGIRNNLEFLGIKPKIYSFSSLFNLFGKLKSKLGKKDSNRLKFWQEEKSMVQYCDLKTSEFNSVFKQMMDNDRHTLLISNHLNRIELILCQLEKEIDILIGLLSSDEHKEGTAIKTLESLHQNASRLESIVENSISGAVNGLKDEIASRISDIFSRDQAGILQNAREFITRMPIDVNQYRSGVKESGFKQILYFMFQDFKRELDMYGIESVQPELKKIVSTQEDRITSYFQSLFDSYQIDLLKLDHYSEFDTVSNRIQDHGDMIDPMDIDKIKKILGLKMPAVLFEAKYTPRIKANVFTDFSLQTVYTIISSVLNRRSGIPFSEGLNKAALKIKKENLKLVKTQFEHYHINLMTQYFSPLISAATRDFKEKINERFNRYRNLKQEIEHLLSLKQSEKKELTKKVLSLKEMLNSIAEELASPDISIRQKTGSGEIL